MPAISGHFHDYQEQIDIGEAVFRAFANFSGRASGAEFWWFFIAATIVIIVLTTIDSSIWSFTILSLLWALALFIPSLAITMRRFHDMGKSG